MKAAIISKTAPNPFAEVAEVEVPPVSADRMLVRTVAVAANPTDWKHVEFLSKSGIIGCDASGIVERVGPEVKGFAPGDVVGMFDRGTVDFVRGKFAQYVLAAPDGCIKMEKASISDKVLSPGSYSSGKVDTFEALASVNLGLVTMSVVFSHSLGVSEKVDNSETYMLVWGGATASGILAVQIARLVYGLRVVTTCSGRNRDFLESLGAEVVDYREENVVEKVREIGGGRVKYVLDTVASEETHRLAAQCVASADASAAAVHGSAPSTYAAAPGASNGSASASANADASADAGTSASSASASANAAADAGVVFDSLLGLSQSSLPFPTNITFVRSLAYTALGEDVQLGQLYKCSPELIANHRHFWYNLLPPIMSQLRTAHLRVLPPGLESTNEALGLLKEGKVSAEKVVFRV